jgi:riboflavin kinase/FMN adenylyltransferase
MKIIKNIDKKQQNLPNIALTIGNFDGIHFGHQKILQKLRLEAKKRNLKTALLTFEPHPTKIFGKNSKNRIYNLSEKVRILKIDNYIDYLFIINFDRNLMEISANDFLENILLNNINMKYLVTGYDFCFGKNRKGDAKFLNDNAEKLNFEFEQIAEQKFNNKTYSSSLVRTLIENGQIKEANNILTRKFSISGIIIKGRGLARNLGYRTANIFPKKYQIRAKFGVYKVEISIANADFLPAILNFGIKPTITDDKKPIFEIYILNFNQDIYGQKVRVRFLDFIREERKFKDINELKKQIGRDIEICQGNNQ